MWNSTSVVRGLEGKSSPAGQQDGSQPPSLPTAMGKTAARRVGETAPLLALQAGSESSDLAWSGGHCARLLLKAEL